MGIAVLIVVNCSLAVSGNTRHQEGRRCFQADCFSFIRPSPEIVTFGEITGLCSPVPRGAVKNSTPGLANGRCRSQRGTMPKISNDTAF